MVWWVTVPRPIDGSQSDAARLSNRPGSRVRYDFVSALTRPTAFHSSGT